LKFSKIISYESNNIVKDNSEYLGLIHLLKWFFQNKLITQWTCVEMAKVLRLLGKVFSMHPRPIGQGEPAPTLIGSPF
jgi:hypothetical protein